MLKKYSAGILLCTAISTVAYADSTPSHIPTIEEIIVTATPLSTDLDQTTGIVGKINRDAILRQGGANLADALADVPGVTGSGFAAGASRPVIRGFDANRVRILENGVGSFDVSDVGPDHGVPIDPLSSQSIEVVRGAATLRYGSQAIGGVVNAINNRIPLSLPENPINGEVTGSYGDNANTRQGSALVDGRLGQFAVHADAFARKTDDYDIPDGTQSNSYFEGGGYSLGSSYFFNDDNSRVGVAGIHYDSQYGIPGEDTYIDMNQDKGLLGSSLAIDGEKLKAINIDAGYADYTHSEIDPVTGERLATFNDKEWDLRSEGILEEVGPFSSAAIGGQLQNRKFSALGEGRNYLKPTKTKTAAGFGFAESKLSETLTLQLGARVERVDVEGTPLSDQKTSHSFTPISGSIGLLFQASDIVTLGLNLSSTARAPAQTELFARGAHDGPATYETGDPDLGMERANSIEGTLRLRQDKARFDAAVWVSSFNDYIYGRITGNTCNEDGICAPGDAEALRELLYEQHNAMFYGAEAKSVITLSQTEAGDLNMELLADYVRATFDNGGGDVPRIPPYHIGGGLTWENDSFNAGFLLKYSAKQNNVPDTETTTKDFTSLEAHVSWRPMPSYPGFELTLIGHNLTDSKQRNAVALNKDEVILPGRDIRLAAHWDF